ncbi:YegP family protein [Paenarthrobacter sp. NPDC057981]|uniref:YegP family protein n=1 Tax=Paenarthrobacter sp. NPDC057981 TaxID=3346297 RepID=UPI0036DB0970
MAGHFELFEEADGDCRVRLVDDDGTELALSVCFPDRKAAAKAIYALREIAASGLVEDHTSHAS